MKSLIMPVVGLPNVGKSSIVNAVLGNKVSIVTHKPHTTRSMIMGARKFDETEVIFVDTPGIEQVSTKLGTLIFNSMKEYLASLDEMLLVLDASAPQIEKFEKFISKSIVVLNKIDRVRKPKLLPIIDILKNLGAKEIFLVSALTSDGIEDLAKYLKVRSNDVESKSYEFGEEDLVAYATECVREKILMQLDQEIPYNVWIEPKFVSLHKNSAWKLTLQIVVPKESYKPIVLGKHGQQIKAIGVAARMEISSKLGQSGFLKLEVVVNKKLWQQDYVYQKLGLQI